MGIRSGGADKPGLRFPPWLGTVLVSALSLGCLLWVYHDFDWHKELPKLARVHWLWIALAVGCDVAVYVSQAWRWNVLMQPVSQLPFWKSVQAIYIGLFANEVLPLRSGELIRCYLVAVWDGVRFPLVLSSALIERLIDGVWLILGYGITTLFVDLPNEIDAGVTVLGSVVASIGVLVAYAVLNPRFARHAVTQHRWAAPLRLLVEGLHDMGRARTFPAALAISVLYLGLQVVPIHAMLMGYGLDLPWGAAMVVLIVLRLGDDCSGGAGQRGAVPPVRIPGAAPRAGG